MAVAIRRPILEFVEEVQVVADGGLQVESGGSGVGDEDGEEADSECDCPDLGGFPC